MLTSTANVERVSPDDALCEASLTRSDIVILGVWDPDASADDVHRMIRQGWPQTGCLMLISVDDDRVGRQAVAAEIGSSTSGDASATDFVDRVARAGRGHMRLCCEPILRTHVLQQEDDLRDLTSQELRILDLVGEGLTNRQIGARMHLAEKTAKNYVSNMLMKLGMSRRTEAAALIARLHERHRLAGA